MEIIGVCDKCLNPNVQPLHRYTDRHLCDLCLEEEKDGRVIKRERDARFESDLKQIVRGVRS
jgi:hypothetical protein